MLTNHTINDICKTSDVTWLMSKPEIKIKAKIKTKENIYMVEWIISNKEWIFSGLGIAIISAFFAI